MNKYLLDFEFNDEFKKALNDLYYDVLIWELINKFSKIIYAIKTDNWHKVMIMLENSDIEESIDIVNAIIEDTQKGIED